eukprot:2601709-Rhodomonas_salina.3
MISSELLPCAGLDGSDARRLTSAIWTGVASIEIATCGSWPKSCNSMLRSMPSWGAFASAYLVDRLLSASIVFAATAESPSCSDADELVSASFFPQPIIFAAQNRLRAPERTQVNANQQRTCGAY